MSAKRLFGIDLLKAQVNHALDDRLGGIEDWAPGDTPIERLFSAALWFFVAQGQTEFHAVLFANGSEAESLLSRPANFWCLLVESQVQLTGWRVDFVVSAYTDGAVWRQGVGTENGPPRWRKLIVECDGHDFHERTKEQARTDRSRDREAAQAGFDVFRFTGSELWADPFGCAEQVYNWAARGLS